MTHKDLVEVAYKWVLKNTSCGVAFKELNTIASETPDVIGFGSWGHSVLVEVKITRTDFLSDKKKSFSQKSANGHGLSTVLLLPHWADQKRRTTRRLGIGLCQRKNARYMRV